MTMRTLLRCLLLTLCASSSAPAFVSRASAEDMVFTPILDGGARWTVYPDGLTYTPANSQAKVSVKRSEDAITYDDIMSKREGCLLTTPWIPSSGKRNVLVFPGMDLYLVRWYPSEEWRWPQQNLFEIQVVTRYRRKATFDSPLPYDFDIHNAVITRDDVKFSVRQGSWISGGYFLEGKRSTDIKNPRPLVINVDTKREGDIAVKICNLGPNAELTVRNMTVETLPID